MKTGLTLILFLVLLLEGAFFLIVTDTLHLNDRVSYEYSLYKILGKFPHEAEPGDIEILRKHELMQLFSTARKPDINTLKGSFRLKVLKSGLNDPQSAALLTGEKVMKICNTKTYIAKSLLDKKKSLHINFQFQKKGDQRSEHDEIRLINQKLFICMIYSPLSAGPENPIPVVLYAEDKNR
jgi:hypothetical protein